MDKIKYFFLMAVTVLFTQILYVIGIVMFSSMLPNFGNFFFLKIALCIAIYAFFLCGLMFEPKKKTEKPFTAYRIISIVMISAFNAHGIASVSAHFNAPAALTAITAAVVLVLSPFAVLASIKKQ